MKRNIPYGRQDISQADIDAVITVLRSDFLTQGPVVPKFERLIAEYCGASEAIAVSSATSALHLACLALDVGPGDYVWTSPITFVATANCAHYCGAHVDFVDINPASYNLDVECLAEKLAQASRDGKVPKVVIPVHLSGQSCDMEALSQLGRQYGFKIIEDASHAVGGRFQGMPVGSCRYSDITVFSFHPVKVITTGEGGMAVTNDAKLAASMRLLRSHGITRNESEMTHPSEGPWYYQQVALGFNYRMTDLQAALGISQLSRLDEFVGKRHELAKRYDVLLAPLPVRTPWQHPDSYSGLHLYVIRLDLKGIDRSHREVIERMRADGIEVNVHYIPVYLNPYYAGLGFGPEYCPEAERYYAEAISLPMFPGMDYEMQDRVVNTLASAVGL